MLDFFDKLFGRNGTDQNSAKIAKDRLQFVLVQDRIKLPPDKMQAMQQEILDVISKYVAIDFENVDFELSNRERTGLLLAEIPFKSSHFEPTDDDDNISIAAPDKPIAEETRENETPKLTIHDAVARFSDIKSNTDDSKTESDSPNEPPEEE